VDALLRFRGAGFFADSGSGLIVESASNTSLGSIEAVEVALLRGRPRDLDAAAGIDDLRPPRVCRRGLFCGSGS
jgi:hypothetical protein